MRLSLLIASAAGLAAALPQPLDSRASPKPTYGNQVVWGKLRKNIKHVIYLMMENHSFDNIAGYWDFNKNMDGLIGKTFCNDYTNPNWTVYGEPLQICAAPYEEEVPLKDPDHAFAGTSYEIYQKWEPTKEDKPNMQGFIERHSEKYNATPGDTAYVIRAYNQKETQVLATIAETFGFWDTYHAEHPGPTNPNRQFATSGSTCGLVDNGLQCANVGCTEPGLSCSVSIFEALSKKGISWKNYYEQTITDSTIYEYVLKNDMDKVVHADQLYKDLEEGTLPQFSYLNPECCTVDSMHPLSNPATGQQMIKHLFDSVRKSKYWDNVLIVINFDEHGGFADHVVPPTNVPIPDDKIPFNGLSDGHNVSYDFSRLGIRVPAFVISPFIPANTLIHDEGTNYAPNSAYTHTSFLHFLQNLWELEGMNNRVQWAKTFEYIFQDTPRTDVPMTLPVPQWIGGVGQNEPEAFPLLNQPLSYYENLGS
ncbi:phospholipase, PLC-D [Rhizodiscina lignyota]|uniref:Phospholipase, PLC-D n=1 Tax=Rhizodiscina lignyota TaxID=1504668 RepID=A0A9P4M809_9PEZI|nr:phospholipase, PLC-D [Rhizodiscina lignyota]